MCSRQYTSISNLEIKLSDLCVKTSTDSTRELGNVEKCKLRSEIGLLCSSVPLPGTLDSYPGLMQQLRVGDTSLILYFGLPSDPGGELLCQVANVFQNIED